jgi:hypothetical protein
MSRVWTMGVVAALCACGRLSFDPLSSDGGTNGDTGDTPGAHVAYLKASNADPGDEFGASLAISRDGSTIAVGAALEGSSARTINGNQADNSAGEAGAVYVFRRTGDVWAQEAYIKASNADAVDQFGWSVALSGDGNLLVVGARGEDSLGPSVPGNNAAPDAGAAYVFARSGPTWTEQGYLKAQTLTAGDKFGEHVAISDDGSTVAIGSPLEDSNATTINGNGVDDSNADAGAVYMFAYVGNQWSQMAYIKAANNDAGDWFGWRVALSATGDVLAVGAYREDSNAIGVDGNAQDDSAGGAGAVYLFTRAGATWSPAAYVKASNTDAGDDFGYGVTISGDASWVFIAAQSEASDGNPANNSMPSTGALYAFQSGPWRQAQYHKSTNPDPNDELGYGIATSMTGDWLIGGASFEDGNSTRWDENGANNSAVDSGAAYLYHLAPPFDTHYVKPPVARANDQFGWACAMSGDGNVIAVSAHFEDSSARGVDQPSDQAAPDAGAVWVWY